MLITETALAYVNHGRWVADCPQQYCGNAMALEANQPVFHCGGPGGCGMVAVVTWPSNAQEIWDALQHRRVPGTRNWFPVGHELAERGGYPMGQTPKELLDEQEMFENAE